MSRGKLVCFSGVDCSGKSTQISLLTEALRRDHECVRVVWYRPGYGPELDGLRALVRRVRGGALPAPGHSSRRDAAFARPGVSATWLGMAVVDTLLQFAVKLRAVLAAGVTVVCDRYVEDALIDLRLRFPELMRRREVAVGQLLHFCPRPDVEFLLLLEREEVLRRAAEKREPFEDGPALRIARIQAYHDRPVYPHTRVIDATASVEEIHKEILSAVRGGDLSCT